MKILSVNISKEKGTIKTPVNEIIVNSTGIENDAHSGNWHRQVSLLAKESIDRFSEGSDRVYKFGEFAENITTEGIDLTTVSLLDRFKIGDAVLEVTQIGKECHGGECAIFQEIGKCVMPKEGIFCRVIDGGRIATGDTIEYTSHPLKIYVITLSDRASRGEYTDKSGPRIQKLLEDHFSVSNFSTEFSLNLIPDDKDALEAKLQHALDENCDLIFTTGGTGISSKDITPDVIKPMLHKEIPGIMEYIRTKYSDKIPTAMLSRSVAGTIDDTLIFTLPGSVKAVTEYIQEISRILNHALLSLKGIETH